MLVIWGISIALTLSSAWLTLKHLNPPPREASSISPSFPPSFPPISILKPLKGVENGIELNLRTFFELDYPEYELLFSIADPNDPARKVVERLMKEFPHIPSRLIMGSVDLGPNPKVNNLIQSYQEAQHDWLLISDSNVRVPPTYLKDLAVHFEPGVGLITALVSGKNPENLGGHLESIFLNTFYARAMILAYRFGRPCVLGKSMLFQRKVANRFGGIRTLARYLAEDYMAGEAMRRLGLRVIIAHHPVQQHIGKYSVHSFWSRHLRWGRIRKAQAPLLFFVEPLLGSVVSGLFGAWAWNRLFNIPMGWFFCFHLGVWALCDLSIARKMGSLLNADVLGVWILRELSSLPLWICIASGNTVNWRGKELCIQSGGILKTL